MRDYLDSTREEEALFKDVFRPGRRSNTGTSSRKRPLSARHDTISDATAETLGKLGSDMDDVINHLGQLERQLTTLDDKVDYQGRQLRKQLKAAESRPKLQAGCRLKSSHDHAVVQDMSFTNKTTSNDHGLLPAMAGLQRLRPCRTVLTDAHSAMRSDLEGWSFEA